MLDHISYLQKMNTTDLSENISIILSKYKYFDVCRAIFCLNSWRYNRSHFLFCVDLNRALKLSNRNGLKGIRNYFEFIELYKELIKFCNCELDDPIIPDVGEIKVNFQGKFYPVIMGTGHDFVFPFLQSLDVLAEQLHATNEIKEVLDYVDLFVERYGKTEQYDEEKYDLTKFQLPPENYFLQCLEYYKEEEFEEGSFLKILGDEESNIDTSHFIRVNKNIYLPIFNSSIIVDAVHYIISSKNLNNEERERIANLILFNALLKNYGIIDEYNKVLAIAGIVCDLHDKKILDGKLFDFILIGEKSVILFLNENRNDNKLGTYIAKAKEFLKKGTLIFAEFLSEGKVKIVEQYNIKNIEIVVFNNDISICDYGMLQYEDKYVVDFLYDVISMIFQSSSVDELCDYLRFELDPSLGIECMNSFGGMSLRFEAWKTNKYELMEKASKNNAVYAIETYLLEKNIFERFINYTRWYPFDSSNKLFENPFIWTDNEKKVIVLFYFRISL